MDNQAITSTWLSIVGMWLVAGCGGVGPSETEEGDGHVTQHAALVSSASCVVAASATPITAVIDTTSSLGKLSAVAVGANAAAWDSNLLDPEVPLLLADAGLRPIRYPGGAISDNYHWLSNTPDDPNQGSTDPSANFDAYMSVVKAARAQSLITVNYGSGTAEEAADWVRYANRGGRHYKGPVPSYSGASSTGHRYGIKYWEIGNEVYGDGTYGATWEVNHNSHDPTTYAKGVVSYSSAMKAVDPSIKIGLVLTMPGNWPDGETNDSSPDPWNQTVLRIACPAIDFVAVHWYPQGPKGESDAGLLMAPENGETTGVSRTPNIPSMAATLKSQIAQYCGTHASAVQIMVTETNSVSYSPGKQTTSLVNALFLDDEVLTWLENGVANVDWWAIHNSPFDGNVASSLQGDYDFGDYGVLSRGLTSDHGAAEPPAETPFPAYHGLRILSHLLPGGPGSATMLSAKSSTDLVMVHAVKQVNGKINVMLINKDPSVAYDVTVTLQEAWLFGLAPVFTYGKDSTSIRASFRPVQGPSFRVTVAPYSVTVFNLP